MTTVTSATSTTTTSSTVTKSLLSSSDTADIDWSAVVEAAVQAKLSKADTIDTKITAKEAKISAYEEMQTLLQTLTDASQALRAPSGYSYEGDDVFNTRAAYLTANGDVDAESSLSVTVESGAQLGSHDITISQIAKSHKIASGTVSDSATDLGYSGVISLGVVDGTAYDITIDTDMSLADIADAINAESGSTGVSASVLKVSSSEYRLIMTTTETGQTIAASAVSGDDVLTSLGILTGGTFTNELQESQDAIFTVDGVTITRDTNEVDDVFDGVTFYLYQATPAATSITVDVETNFSEVKSAIQTFVDAYNAYRDFAVTHLTTTDSEDVTETALFGDGTLRNITNSILDALNERIGGLSMATLGLSFDKTNNLVLDEDVLDDALLTNLADVKAMLAFEMDASSSDLGILARGTGAPSSFTLDITVDGGGNLTSASVGGDASLFTVEGTRIVGVAGTAYEGFSFVYTGTTTQSIDVTISSGIAELMHRIAEGAGDETSGTLETILGSLAGQVEDMQAESDSVRSRAEDYRTRLTARYAEIQAAIQEAASLKNYLETLLQAAYSS